MQERLSNCILEETARGNSEAALVEEDVSMLSDVGDVADMVEGYVECMAEAVRYLIEVEKYPEGHPAVEALKYHLAEYRRRFLASALYSTVGHA